MRVIRPVLAAAFLLFTWAGTACPAEPYPDRPVRMLVGGAPGSVPDTVIRFIATRLTSELGQPVVVENRPGAGGVVAMEVLARSPADGYTLAVATMSQAVFNPLLFARLPYDAERDLEPVATLVTGAMVLAAHPSFPGDTLESVARLARAGTTKPFIAMPQTGSPPHVVALLLQRTAQFDASMVPYKSGAEAVAAVVAGEVPLVIEAPTALIPLVRAGKLKALVVTGATREPALPDTPTVGQSGYPDVHGEAWIGLVAPAGTPVDVVTRINAAVARVLAEREVAMHMDGLGFRTLSRTPAGFRELLAADRVKWSVVIRAAGLRLD
jgi:tripartite-type tricarboxylate transporter receptor subunit TctC